MNVFPLAITRSFFKSAAHFFIIPTAILLSQTAQAEPQPLSLSAIADDNPRPRGQIIVGVRPDARPFSYRTASRLDESTLPDFGGYMIEICRRVLADMTTGSGPFHNFIVVAREVDVANRFHALETESVDMLCGPDSITPNRLAAYNVSHPVFLSGLTWVTIEDEDFPRRAHCDAIIGLLARTTAETIGLQVLADNNELFRFDEALEQYLAKVRRGGNTRHDRSLLSNLQKFLSKNLNAPSQARTSGLQWVEPVRPGTIKTEECPNGFNSGPVVQFSSHSAGLKALCSGDIFYYLGDRDILRSKVAGMPSCLFDVKPETMTREAYGAYFRKTQVDLQAESNSLRGYPDSALQAEFNNVLLRLMQESANILDYEFKREFAPEHPTDDLQNFFDSFKFASHHIREN